MYDILIYLYIIFSVYIGLKYFDYWVENKQPEIVKQQSKKKRFIIYLLIGVIGTVLAPISLYDLIVFKKQTKKEKKL